MLGVHNFVSVSRLPYYCVVLLVRDVLSTWSSGTGVATFVGPLLYSGLTSTGLNPRRVLLAMASVPLLMGVR